MQNQIIELTKLPPASPIPDQLSIKAPNKAEKRTLSLLIMGGVMSVLIFTIWFWTETKPGYPFLFILFTVTVSFKLLRLLHEWYHYAAISVPTPPPLTKEWSVDMLTTFCAGEPYDMVIDTLRAMKAVRYPHTTYLCDEDNDPYLKQICHELGVVHVYRGPQKRNAKAGNINYALETHATGEIAIILDPDHKPRPDFIDKTLPYFENDKVGFVQCVQAYGNQSQSLIAKGAAEHTYHFYGPMMMSMNTYGTVQAIGANCTFRRAALDSIGGHAAGLSEDMHTAMCLHSAGWRSVYVPENLSRGLVPSTLGSFYKQQLKWSRGSFDLLFYKFPALIKGYTWRQIVHYLTIPLYFLSGLISAIDIFLPMLALVLAKTPLLVDFTELVQATLPMLFFLFANRLYVQRWTLERQEKGLHFWGGVLMLTTWWIYLTGLVYTLFKIKVPYIPTPKDDEIQDEWRICIPNLLVMGLGIASILYGLSLDWSPYSWFMAALVMTNVVMLGIGILIAQRKTISSFYYLLMHGKLSGPRKMWSNFRHEVIYKGFRSNKVATSLSIFIIGAIVASFVIPFKPEQSIKELDEKKEIHQYRGIMWGIEGQPQWLSTRGIQAHVHMAMVRSAWDSTQKNTGQPFSHAFAQGFVPYLKWEFPNDSSGRFYEDVLAGCYDGYIARISLSLAHQRELIYVQLRPEGQIAPLDLETYKALWQHVVGVFQECHASNVAWIWPMHLPEGVENHLPDPAWIDGWEIRASGPTEASQRLSRFVKAQTSLAEKALFITKVNPDSLVSEANWKQLGRTPSRLASIIPTFSEQAELMHSFSHMSRVLEEVGTKEAPVRPLPMLARDHIETRLPANGNFHKVKDLSPKSITQVVGNRQEGYTLTVGGQPFYIKGVAYNPGHDWRDGYSPLVRERLKNDFTRIKAMGANTIRRYNPSLYDSNILKLAEESDLKVLYGFWFDPAVDYYRETDQIKKYRAEALQKVLTYRDHPAILAWTIGNEAWGLIKQYNQELYTPRVRRAYLLMLESLAQEIHRLDPTRPVMTMLEHSPDLERALADYHRFAPSIDVIGVNSYYKPRIRHLPSVMAKYNPDRPYLVSEFGPKGYWDPDLSAIGQMGRVWEESDLEKAQGYYDQWQYYIQADEKHNLGGVAFCWRDRMEGSLTWFGLTDLSNRKKLAYYALRMAWAQDTTLSIWPDIRVNLRPFTHTQYEASINIPENLATQYDYAWTLVRDEYLYEVGSAEADHQDCRKAVFELPSRPDSQTLYRIYLHMDDGQGNVITASHPISPVLH